MINVMTTMRVAHNSSRRRQNKKWGERNSRLIIESIVKSCNCAVFMWGANPAIYYEIICALTFSRREKMSKFYDRFGKREIRRGRSDRFQYYYFSVVSFIFFIYYQ